MTDDDVDTIEGQLGVTMPADYRVFVRSPPAPFLLAYGGHELFADPRFVVNATRESRAGDCGRIRSRARRVPHRGVFVRLLGSEALTAARRRYITRRWSGRGGGILHLRSGVGPALPRLLNAITLRRRR
jgi:hypothetical protein